MWGWRYLVTALLLAASAGCQGASSGSTPTPTPTPAAATPLGPTIGRQYFNQTKAAYQAKKWADAARLGDLAADMLVNESGTDKELREAHKMAGQAHYKLKHFEKALKHYQALSRLEPGNKQYKQVAAELTRRTTKPQKPLNSPLTPAQQAKRQEALLNQTIRVRVTSQFNPMGTVVTMTRREYLRRKASGEYE